MAPSEVGSRDHGALAAPAELFTGPAFADAFATPPDRPGKPQVLLIGDSISIGYTLGVRRRLYTEADVHRIPGNGQTVGNGLDNIERWIAGRPWSVIHFNWGLWDICYRHPEAQNQGHRDKIRGTIGTTPASYQASLGTLVERLASTGARLIWAATTPVPDGEPGRHAGDEIHYNELAADIMRQRGIPINDLHARARERLPGIAAAPGDVHFTWHGYEHLADQVAATISRSLGTLLP